MVVNEHEIYLVDSAADFGAFTLWFVMDLFGHLRLLALPFLRGRLSTRTVLASLSGGGLSFQSTHVLVTVPSACCFLSWMSEDAFFSDALIDLTAAVACGHCQDEFFGSASQTWFRAWRIWGLSLKVESVLSICHFVKGLSPRVFVPVAGSR